MQSSTLMYHRGGKEFRAPTVSSSTSTSSATTTHSATSTTNMRPPPPPPPTTKAHLKDVSSAAKEPQQRSAEEPSSSIPDLEFDGTTVLCRVCGDKASGFHYGVHSCEGCKGFFRRSIQQKIQYRPCTKNQQCSILRINRNRCQYCRLKKCIAVGMSRDAVRFGRVPKREKARILAAMQQSSNSRSLEKAVAAELEDDQRLLATVVRAHLDTCDFTREKVEPMLQRARDQPSYTACPPTLACPLNPNPQPLTGQQELLQDFSKRFSPAIRGVVEFAKRIPGFSLLAQDDQVTLLKAGVFEVLLVRLACMFDAHTSSMVCLNGQVLRRDSIHNSSNARFLMDSMFDFAERVNALRLSDAEIGLFCSVVVIAADRPGLRNTELIERMHSKLRNALHSVMAQNRPGQPDACHELMKKIPDLRTLNTLHSEKLLAFKMTEQQQQLQQQQLNGHQQWSATVTSHHGHHPQTHHEDESKSPAASSWSSGSDVTIDEAKSPLGSVSSTESVCSAEISASVAAASISSIDYHHHPHHQHHSLAPQHPQHHHQQATSQHASSAPLLAATLAGSLCPHRHRANSGSSGDDELAAAAHLVHNGLTITPVRSHHQHHQMTRTFRKLDSPSDSGIESGAENRQDRLAPGSAPTSLCSSPRSSLEDHTDDHHTNKTSLSGSSSSRSVEDMPVLKRVLQAPPLYDTNSLMDEAYKPHKKFRALRNAKDSAEAEPAVHPQYPTPAASVSPVSIPPQTQPSTMTHLSAALTQSQPQQSSLSSTHSTLAKSLMEGPRMTAEQMKRTDIIHNYIMGGNLLVCASPNQNYQQQQQSPHHQSSSSSSSHSPQPQYPQVSWPSSNGCSTPPVAYGTSVITTTQATCRQSQPAYVLVSNSPVHQAQTQPAPGDVQRIYFHPQSPAHSTSASPTPQHHQHIKSPPVSPSSSMTKQLVELQVDIADSQQPLNLSKKSPSPSPRLKLEA